MEFSYDELTITRSFRKEGASQISTYFYENHEDSTSFPMNKIATLQFGKRALLGGSWNGVMDLQNIAQKEIFEQYLGF